MARAQGGGGQARRRRRGPWAAPPPRPAGAAAGPGGANGAPSRGAPDAPPRIPDAAAAARTRAILPRLEYARALLGDVCSGLSDELSRLSRRNARLAAAGGGLRAAAGAPSSRPPPPAARDMLADELAVRLAVLALAEAAAWLARAGRTAPVPDDVPAAISVLRRVSSALHGACPAQSALLCEASSVLGGVLADSAAVAGARLDFGRSNAASSAVLAQAKLTAESKLDQLYPNGLGARGGCMRSACPC